MKNGGGWEVDPASPPRSAGEVWSFVEGALGIRLARARLIPDHHSPLDYLAHAFLCDLPGHDGARDCVVWASRGGGKTFLGALATLLDMIFKPGIEIRILGGSLDQSKRMYAHLRRLVDERRNPSIAAMVKGRFTERRLVMRNGSEVELLAQSQTSVRGTRVQKLRCDEVDLFDPDVWDAAQLTTRERACAGFRVLGSVECLSTMHVPHGVMHRLVREASEGARRLFRWGLLDVLGECPPARACRPDGLSPELPDAEPLGTRDLPPPAPGECGLYPECRGRAKARTAEIAGHIGVEEAIAMKRRVPLPVWGAEMLCLRPTRSSAVLPEFDPALHVFEGDAPPRVCAWVGGMDFGIRSPAVVLWACLDYEGVLRVMDERHAAGVVLAEHIRAIEAGLARPGVPAWPALAWIGVDPAGRQSNEQSGVSSASLLRRAGLDVRAVRRPVEVGLSLVRVRLQPSTGGPPRLFIHKRCEKLIESLEQFHYPVDQPESLEPVKGEGFDHAVDALRYMVLNLDAPSRTASSNYAAVPGGRG